MRWQALVDAMRAQARGLEEKEKEIVIGTLTKKKRTIEREKKRRTIDGQKAIEGGQWRPED
jgi:hypothetical protein